MSEAARVAQAEVGPATQLVAFYADGSDEAVVAAGKLSLEMIAETATWFDGNHDPHGPEAAEKVRVWWLNQVRIGADPEDAEELEQRWAIAFEKAKAAEPKEEPKAKAEENAKVDAEPKPEPEEAKVEIAPKAKSEHQPKWPDAPLPPDGATELERLAFPLGLLGHVTQYMVDASDLPDRWLALASALVVLGKGLDRKVIGPSGSSTVLYILLMAESGAGKQQAIRMIRMVLKAMELENVIAANSLSSIQAIEEIVEEMPSSLILCDEIGGWLNRISATGQTGNVAEIPATLQSLWAWSPELNWIGTKRKGKEMVTVFGPAMSIFGDSTEAKLIKGLTREEIANGFLNRWLLFGIGRGAPRRVKPKYHWTEIPKWLEKAIKEVVGKPVPAKGLVKLTLPKPNGGGDVVLQDFRRIGWGPDVEELFLDYEEFTRALPSVKDRDLWIRAPEQAVRLATILAFYRGPPRVEVKDWEWAVEVVKYSMSQLERSLSKHQRDKLEQVELVDKIRDEFLRENLPVGTGRKVVGELTEGQIHKFCERLCEDYRKINFAIDHLLKIGEIEEFTPVRRGPPTRHFRWRVGA